MANWPTSPDWIPITEINNGKEVDGSDGFLASDQNKIVSNILYLYQHFSAQHVYVGNVTTVTGIEKTDASVQVTARSIDTDANGETELYLDFVFTVPRGTSAKFATPTIAANTLAPNASPTASITAAGDDEHKQFNFTLGLPRAPKVVKSETETLLPGLFAEVNIVTDANGDLQFYFKIPQGEQGEKGDKGDVGDRGPRGDKGEKGDPGPQGEKGDTGPSGIQVATKGMFTLEMEANGDLYVNYVDEGEAPQFEYDSDTGELYYIIP